MSRHFSFIGQVDVGKSTLAGHLLYKCGLIEEHEFEMHKKNCEGSMFAFWSRFLDIYEGEQARSKTFEYKTIDLYLDEHKYVLIDTPGHKFFIRSLIEAISSYPDTIGCVLISARKGEFESGFHQTKEDIILAKSLGIDQIVILVNKMDTVDWDQGIYKNILEKTNRLLKACKFSHVSYIPISGYEGIGLVDKCGMPEWYNGKCFLDVLKSIPKPKPDINTITLPESWSKMIVEVKIIALEGVFSPGYKCIVHYCGQEKEVTIGKIKEKPFLKHGDSGIVLFQLDQPLKEGRNQRIIIRSSGLTIGFGKIVKIL